MKKIKNVAMLIIFMIVAIVKTPVSANSEVNAPIAISPRYVNIASTSTGLSNSNGSASCVGSIQAYSSSSSLKVFLYLEKKVSGTWTQAGSWYDTKTGSSLTLTKKVSVGNGTYRVKASYYANGENTVKYSAEKTF